MFVIIAAFDQLIFTAVAAAATTIAANANGGLILVILLLFSGGSFGCSRGAVAAAWLSVMLLLWF